MKKLYLLRHAEAIDFSEAGDFERSLSERGRKQATQVGMYIKEHRISFDKVLSSSSRRTCETLDLLNVSLKDIEKSSLFYNATCYQILDIFQRMENEIQSILYIGHNPCIGLAACEFSEILTVELSRSYEPATLCGYRFDIKQWQDLRWKQGKIISFYSINKI